MTERRLLPVVPDAYGVVRAPYVHDHPSPRRSRTAHQHDELSEYLGVPVKTIYDWRLTGHGPARSGSAGI
jgi:hypothetical protein